MIRISLFAAAFLVPGLALAQVYVGPGRYQSDGSGDPRIGRSESPQSWAVELKGGPYYPPLDKEFGEGGPTPFADIFGEKPALLLLGEIDYQAIRLPIGSFGPALGFGFYQKTGFGLDANGEPTEDKNFFRIYPLSLNAVLRVDYFLRAMQIPFVPFAKAGVDWYLWTNTKNGELTRFPNGNPVQGGTFGFHGTLGLSLDLNFLDPSGAVNIDQNLGVNHSYLFAEVIFSQVNDFNSGQSFDFSGTLLQAGVALEF